MEPFYVDVQTLPTNLALSSTTLYIDGIAIDSLTGNARRFLVTPRKPKSFSMHVKTKISGFGSEEVSSDAKTFHCQYPDYNRIVSEYGSVMNTLWDKTAAACNSQTCREYGATFFMDTRETASAVYGYEEKLGVEKPSNYAGGGAISLTYNNTESTNPKGGIHYIGIFHTHPPRVYVSTSRDCPVGPSDGDNYPETGMPAILMDYIKIKEAFNNDTGKSFPAVPGGYPANSSTMLYNYGGNRRTN